MRTAIVYDSQYGNTERIAQGIADALREYGEVRTVRIGFAHADTLQGIDTLILGSPTQGWNATQAMRAFLDQIPAGQLHGLAIACFDTRFQKPRWMTGSAAVKMAKRLQRMGFSLIALPESFFVKGSEGPLLDGELERAAIWARMIHNRMETPHAVTP